MKQLFLLGLLLCTSVQAEELSQANFTMQANELIKQFSAELKATLQQTLQSQGPVAAIAVCKVQAPQIAQSLSEQYGLNIARTSLKTRNPNNVPDEWEKSVLDRFEQRHQAGETIKQLSFVERKDKQWRMMKAIPTGKVCLSCHGSQLGSSVSAQLKALYPDDQATGFKLGDIRGAFTVSEPPP